MTQRIALISAVPAAIPPATAAIAAQLPNAQVWNLLDDQLLFDADAAGGLNDQLRARMLRLIAHARAEGADAVLLTCSLYGPVAQSLVAEIPVLAPDQAAFDDVASGGFGSVLVVASFQVALDDSIKRLQEVLASAGSATQLTGVVAAGALTATKAGDRAALEAALLSAVQPATNFDAILLAQYSLAPAGAALAAAIGRPVLSGPASSALRLRGMLQP